MYVLGEQKLTRSQCKAKGDSVAWGAGVIYFYSIHISKELAFAPRTSNWAQVTLPSVTRPHKIQNFAALAALDSKFTAFQGTVKDSCES